MSGVRFNMNIGAIEAYEIDQDEKLIRETRLISWNFLNFIFAQIENTSMNEKEIVDFIYAYSKDYNIDKHWHSPKVKIDESTFLAAENAYVPNLSQCISHQSLVSIDLGPVVNGIEGDVGETRCFNISDLSSKLIIELASKYFNEFKSLINNRYSFANAAKTVHDYFRENQSAEFQLDLNLHLLGKAFHKQFISQKINLTEFDYYKKQSAWILEVSIFDSKRRRASFFEDLL